MHLIFGESCTGQKRIFSWKTFNMLLNIYMTEGINTLTNFV